MAFWNDDAWERSESGDPVIIPFDQGSIEDAKYKLSVGPEIYISTGEDRNTKQLLSEKEPFIIKPGEFAFILTEERVNIPTGCIGFISMSTRLKFAGLANVSGFHVDPGYSGRLIFAVVNSGPTRINLERGQKIFSLWLAALDGVVDRKITHGWDSIPSDIIDRIGGNFVTAYQVSEKHYALAEQVSELETNFLRFRVIVITAAIVTVGLLSFVFQEPVWSYIKSVSQSESVAGEINDY